MTTPTNGQHEPDAASSTHWIREMRGRYPPATSQMISSTIQAFIDRDKSVTTLLANNSQNMLDKSKELSAALDERNTTTGSLLAKCKDNLDWLQDL